MRVTAYVVVADPTWIEKSVAAYYDRVDAIVVSHDVDGLGWTGAPVDSASCLTRLKAIDTAAKLRFVTGDYHQSTSAPENELAQRRAALAAAGAEADWVLQIDTDEVLPDVDALVHALRHAEDRGLGIVEWPMRVLYRRLDDRSYLVVTGRNGHGTFEYPGPIAVRPGVRLNDARRADGPFLRPLVEGDDASLQVTRPPEDGEDRSFTVTEPQTILHNSWARSPAVVRRKIRAWGHYEGWRSWRYYLGTWLPSRYLWRWQRDLHPFAAGLWPRLGKVEID